jgi:hypothetical protein
MARPPTSRVPAATSPAGSISGRLWGELRALDLARADEVRSIVTAKTSSDSTEDKEMNLDLILLFHFTIAGRHPTSPHGQYRADLGSNDTEPTGAGQPEV